ncbi:dihydroneopterin aldolase [Kaistella sp. 97-N-M2]|uniref:dihydroneopterin aldolase n=1 Tax=Kaistella sp. 97-N-M2 TaxID=2908645 RepID=UPI001F1D1237|nr:dihydroneopterin aldolase [Kaistella sp. 97-N-M2]UJF28739.1 dihydroneopterin aldolase [Kaistella sp. 97-N-M2]
MTSKIILENLKIYAFHGVLPEEKIIGTTFILNVEVHADLWKATETDDLQDTINYAAVNDILHAEMSIPSQLLEHIIGRIFKKLQVSFPQITFIKIKLTKTNPPMRGEMDGVSIEMAKEIHTK